MSEYTQKELISSALLVLAIGAFLASVAVTALYSWAWGLLVLAAYVLFVGIISLLGAMQR